MDIGLKLSKSLESKHGLFMMGHIKDDFKNLEFHSYLINQ